MTQESSGIPNIPAGFAGPPQNWPVRTEGPDGDSRPVPGIDVPVPGTPANNQPLGASPTAESGGPLPGQGTDVSGTPPPATAAGTADPWDAITNDYVREGETWILTLPLGQKITIREVSSAKELLQIGRKAQEVYRTVKRGAIPASWEPYKYEPEEVITEAHKMSEMLIDPPCPFLKALDMARRAGALFMFISTTINEHTAGAVGKAVQEEVTATKNG